MGASAARHFHGGVEVLGTGQFQAPHHGFGLGARHGFHFGAQTRDHGKGAASHSGKVVQPLASIFEQSILQNLGLLAASVRAI